MTFYIDLDCTLWDTIDAVNRMYDEDYGLYPNYRYTPSYAIRSWNFDELELGSAEYFDLCFDSARFFRNIQPMPYARTFCESARAKGHKIIIVSIGTLANLTGKTIWLEDNFKSGYDDFIGLDINKHNDKHTVDMSDGILIDDVESILKSSNALRKICFGEKYPWNESWDGERVKNWQDALKLLGESE